MSDSNDRREKGKAFARRILKDGPPPFPVPRKFQRYTLENVFGDLWQDELELRLVRGLCLGLDLALR